MQGNNRYSGASGGAVLALAGLAVACIAGPFGCDRSPRDSGRVESAPAPIVPVAPAPPVASTPAPVASVAMPAEPEWRSSVATFHHDALDECVDFAITLPPGRKASEIPPFLADAGTPLTKPCDATFKDRTVLASCTVRQTVTGEAGVVEMAIASRYYNFETTRSDSYMRDCLRMKGEWQELPRDSDAYKHAKIRHDAERVIDMAKNLPH